jgi:hypothetical protein
MQITAIENRKFTELMESLSPTQWSTPTECTLWDVRAMAAHLVGSAAVKPCLWLNRSLRGGDQCYKHHFYGISSHRCVQMTPTLECNHHCLHCWRPIDDPVPGIAPLEPAKLLEGILLGQQKFLSGYGGAKTTDLERLKEARLPKHVQRDATSETLGGGG